MRPELPDGPYLVVGLARSGVAALRALASRGLEAIGYDADAVSARPEVGLGTAVHTGGSGVELLDRVRCVVKSPGVPRETAVVAAALDRGIVVLGEMELGWRMVDRDFIAVTGTNGKTTTVELIGAIHRAAGIEVEVVGNVGTAVCELALASLSDETVVVCEASSFQLEDTDRFAPDAAVLLNVTEDHLDRHHTFHSYKEAKLRVFAAQEEQAIAVVPAGLVDRELATGGLAIPGSARRVTFGELERCDLELRAGILHWHGDVVIPASELGARGPVENAQAAAAVTLARGIPIDAVREALRTFTGVAHRLEQVARLDGVLYVNDSKATNVASTLVALDAFDRGSVLLILGGQGKGQDFTPLRDAVADRVAHTYVIGEDAERIAAALHGLANTDAGTLEHAVELAREASAPGMVVLLSPACASFDQFADFEARGEAFRTLVTRQA